MVLRPVLASVRDAQLKAIVDIGSNGIRFSVTDLSEPTARNLPTIVFERVAISVHDAQHRDGSGERRPIPDDVIDNIVANLHRWQYICYKELQISLDDMALVATEATRSALNVDELRHAIETNTVWKLTCLPKKTEAVYGVFGIASSLTYAEGLVMDLGGGSVQLSWIIAKDGRCDTSHETAQSLPYGAAILTKLLAEEDRHVLKSRLEKEFKVAYEALDLPDEIKEKIASGAGVNLYLSGGGFRGWGHLLMSLRKLPKAECSGYPIPLINGFSATGPEFFDTRRVGRIPDYHQIFRISKRRAQQVPAIMLMVDVLREVLPEIRDVHFCQGGIREGKLFNDMPAEVRAKAPVVTASAPCQDSRTPVIVSLLQTASQLEWWPAQISQAHLLAFASLVFYHHPVNKDARAAAALRSTTTGMLTKTHGLSHLDRAVLALLLTERWKAKLDPDNEGYLQELQAMVGPEVAWWAQYLGRIAHLLGVLHPTSFLGVYAPRVTLTARVSHSLGSKGRKTGIKLLIELQSDSPLTRPIHIEKLAHDIEKVGKKKNWIQGYGKKIDVEVTRTLQ